ncbi:hypothetical protein NX059_002696 [Plenodomus lindquistii]|nr:hypothetical protein NX059_002696 [Plenodomus lindquistii]
MLDRSRAVTELPERTDFTCTTMSASDLTEVLLTFVCLYRDAVYIGRNTLCRIFEEILPSKASDAVDTALVYGAVATGAQLKWLDGMRNTNDEHIKLIASQYYHAALAQVELHWRGDFSVKKFQVRLASAKILSAPASLAD